MQKLMVAVCFGLLMLWVRAGHATEQRDTAAFSAIDLNGSYQTTVTTGRPQSITISGKDALGQIATEVKNSILRIYQKNPSVNLQNITLQINMPKLQGLTLAGNNKFNAKGLAEKELSINASGANQITLEGSVDTFNVDLKGSTMLDAKELTAKTIMINANGSAQIATHTNNELNVKAAGDVLVKIYGTPRILNTSLSGNSKLQVAN